MRKNQRRYGVVVIDDVALGDAFAGIKDLVEIRELEAMALDFERNFGGRLGGNQRSVVTRSSGPCLLGSALPFGSLSVRSAMKTGARSNPSGVISRNLISATSSGFTQVTSRSAFTVPAEGTLLRDERLKFAINLLERLLVESGSHLPDMHQLFAVVTSQHQRAEVVALAVRESADDEVVRGVDLDLQPVAAAAAFVLAGTRALPEFLPGRGRARLRASRRRRP